MIASELPTQLVPIELFSALSVGALNNLAIFKYTIKTGSEVSIESSAHLLFFTPLFYKFYPTTKHQREEGKESERGIDSPLKRNGFAIRKKKWGLRVMSVYVPALSMTELAF